MGISRQKRRLDLSVELRRQLFFPTGEPSYHLKSAVTIQLKGEIPFRARVQILALCAAVVGGLTIGEHYTKNAILMGFLYLVPLLVVAVLLSRWTLLAVAIAVALERECFAPYSWDQNVWLRLPLNIIGYSAAVFLFSELVQNRKAASDLLERNRREQMLRSDAEHDARALVESSPAAVLTVNSLGMITMANEAAGRLLGFLEGSPEGHPIDNYIPILVKILGHKQDVRTMRTVLEAHGRRQNGETFISQIWVFLYRTTSGPRLTAILSEAREHLLDQEESGLRQLLSSSRVIAGAVSHEIRNLTAAASILYDNTSNAPGFRGNADFATLGRVIESILKLSSKELQEDDEREVLEGVDIAEVLEELQTMITPTFKKSGVSLEWEIDEGLSNVRASHSGLLQVFINLAQNSCRALANRPDSRLRVMAFQLTDSVVVRFSDNGPGMQSLERLFQPLQPGATSTGLGLFISRAIIQTFGGELHHAQRPGECAFIIELPAMEIPEGADGQ
jgi:two-component system sensor kinase FixL